MIPGVAYPDQPAFTDSYATGGTKSGTRALIPLLRHSGSYIPSPAFCQRLLITLLTHGRTRHRRTTASPATPPHR